MVTYKRDESTYIRETELRLYVIEVEVYFVCFRPACPSSLFHTWETLLQEVEIDSQAHSDIASILGRQVSRPLLERSFHRKIQSRKVFTHRESYETILTKTEDKLGKVRSLLFLFNDYSVSKYLREKKKLL